MSQLAKLPDYEPLLALIADGMTLTDACGVLGIDRRAFWHAMKSHPDLQARFAASQELQGEAQADTLTHIHHMVRDPIMCRVASENLRWLLSKRQARVYGDKLAIEAQANSDLTAVLKAAIDRIPRPALTQSCDQPITIEAESVTMSDIFGEPDV